MLSEIEKKNLWLEDRKTLITGTNLACILGLSKFGGSMSVWLEKKGKLEVQDNEAMFSGRLFEKPILEAYSKINEIPITYAD